ncbi:MAG TPA: MobA/MobL family protein, partial [Saprospiraceae bacterium]|nr:MobA/MobL family protein [Saprospiraceae bacterium]
MRIITTTGKGNQEDMKTPIYHIGLIRRSKGTICSAVDAMAYILGKNWKSAYDGQSYDHENKAGEVVYSRVLAPTDTPEFAFQPFVLAHAIEWCESMKNAQLMRHIYFSLPPELSRELQVALLNEYAQTFVDKGMVAIVALHDAGLGNPNGHLLLTMRPLLPDGTFAPKSKNEPLVDGQGQKIKGKDGRCKRKKIPTTDWDYMGNGELWRRTWADITNTYYKMAGLDLAIDYRSLKRQGIIRIPTVYLNPTDHQAERRGERTEIGDLNRWIHAENERREKEELRQEAINQLLEAFKEKYNGLAKRKQYLSPQTRATQQFWQDLHAIES